MPLNALWRVAAEGESAPTWAVVAVRKVCVLVSTV